MKLLLLSAFCVLSVCVFAQAPKKTNPYSFQLPDTLKKFKGNENAFRELREYWQRKQMQNNSPTNKSGSVVILPQDHMPCVVPNTVGIAKMPNAWSNVSIPYIAPNNRIPNPGLPKMQSFKWNALDNGLGIPSK